jgi:hypothetical protein
MKVKRFYESPWVLKVYESKEILRESRDSMKVKRFYESKEIL